MSYEAMLRAHVRENNKRLGALERKSEKYARRIEVLRKNVNILLASRDLVEDPDPEQKLRA